MGPGTASRGVESTKDARARLVAPPVVLCGSAHPELATALARQLGLALGPYGPQRFPDGEIYVEVGADVHARHAILVQPTHQSGGEHLLELLLMADACRRAGARAVTAVIPYVGYARQDHRTRSGQALGMRVVGELLSRERFDHVIAVELHAEAVEGFIDAPLEHVSAVPLLAEALRAHAGKGAVVVSPDLGAAKLAHEYARILELPVAIVHKTRMSPTEVTVDRIIGDVGGLRPIIVDDMITTAGTMVAAARALLAAGCSREITAVATHALLVSPAVDRLRAMGLHRLIVSNTVPSPKDLPFACDVVDVAPLIASAVRRVCAVR